jgi:hypothetical protein
VSRNTMAPTHQAMESEIDSDKVRSLNRNGNASSVNAESKAYLNNAAINYDSQLNKILRVFRGWRDDERAPGVWL